MKRFIIVLTVIAATFSISPLLWAKTFYLKNGDEIEYQSYRQKEGTIYLLINRDTEVEFPVKEVDLAKTVKAAGESKKVKQKKHAKRHSVKKAVKHAGPSKMKKTAPAAIRTSAAKPAPATKPAPSATPAPAKGGPAKIQSGNPASQK